MQNVKMHEFHIHIKPAILLCMQYINSSLNGKRSICMSAFSGQKT